MAESEGRRLRLIRLYVPFSRRLEKDGLKYYYANRQEDTDWVVLPVANFDAYFGLTSFSKKRLTELVKSGAIERENSYNVSRYRLNEVFT